MSLLMDMDTLLWHEWRFPGTTIYRHEPGERRGESTAEKRGEKCGEKRSEKHGEKGGETFQKDSCLGFIRIVFILV